MKRRIADLISVIDQRVTSVLAELDRKLYARSGVSIKTLPRDIHLWFAIFLLIPIAAILGIGAFVDQETLNLAVRGIDAELPRYFHLIFVLPIAAHLGTILAPVLRWLHERLDYNAATSPSKELGSGYFAWASLLGVLALLCVGFTWIFLLVKHNHTVALIAFVWFWLTLLVHRLLDSWQCFLSRPNTPRRKKKRAPRLLTESLQERLARMQP